MKWFVGTFTLISIFSSCGVAQSCPGSVPANMSCVAHGAAKAVSAFTVTKSVTNNSPNGMAIMIPLGTSTEWSMFYNTPPVGVTIGTPAYRLTSLRCAPFTAPCYYTAGWEPMRCSQAVDVGKTGTTGGCQTMNTTYTTAGTQAVTLFNPSYGYNWECEYRCDYY